MADLTPITREEKIIAGEDVKPVTREEKILAGMDIVPVTRREKFLKAFGGGGSGGDDGGEVLKLKDFSYFFADGVHQEYAGKIDTSEATNFEGMFTYFAYSPRNTDWVANAFPILDTSKGTDFSEMFARNTQSVTFPKLNTSNGIDFQKMFYNCEAMVTAPELDLQKGTNFDYMFQGCKNLISFPKFNASNGVSFRETFNSCAALESVDEIDVSNGTDFYFMFRGCSALTSIPEFDTSNGTVFTSMFASCKVLETIPKLDLSNANRWDTSGMLESCTALKNLYLYNIGVTLTIGSGTSWGHLLTVDSLVHTIKELRTVKSTQKLTMGSANLEKIANLYCKIIDDTHEKKTMELCESTDEGAMTLIDYAALKGWQIL